MYADFKFSASEIGLLTILVTTDIAITNSGIQAMLGVSRATAWRMVRRLRKAGMLTKMSDSTLPNRIFYIANARAQHEVSTELELVEGTQHIIPNDFLATIPR